MKSLVHEFASWDEMWKGADQGLIASWQRGREKRVTEPELACRAEKGELIALPWKGGTENIDQETDDGTKTSKTQKRFGTFWYLAMWQGLRDEDLNVELDSERTIVCTKTNRAVIFRLVLESDSAT